MKPDEKFLLPDKELVKNFCCLGERLNASGRSGAAEAVKTRVC